MSCSVMGAKCKIFECCLRCLECDFNMLTCDGCMSSRYSSVRLNKNAKSASGSICSAYAFSSSENGFLDKESASVCVFPFLYSTSNWKSERRSA
jgi:hypothetical protein